MDTLDPIDVIVGCVIIDCCVVLLIGVLHWNLRLIRTIAIWKSD